jgi:hypothetical protein
MDACFPLLHFLLFEKQLDDVRDCRCHRHAHAIFFVRCRPLLNLSIALQESQGAYLCPDPPDKYLARDLHRALQPLGISQVPGALGRRSLSLHLSC